ncbi:MAG: aldo/keto reductase family protein [Myxococcales bacterium]|nr:aldo/keto reductase family protein [Myxococcales bacterium]
MEYRRLGRSGIKLSEVGLGGWLTFAHVHDELSGRAIIDKAFECGINFFDTANVYGRGSCEEQWGRLLAGYRRSSFVLATKVFFPMGNSPNERGLSRKHIMEQCEASLRRLRIDYIDLYQCHRLDAETPLDETIRAMDDLISQGKIHYWGFSSWPSHRILETMKICGDRYYAPVSSQPKYNLLIRDVEIDVMGTCRENGIGQVVSSPLEQGILTGKYQPGMPLPEDSRAVDDHQNQFMIGMANDEDLLTQVQKLRVVADSVNASTTQLSLAWILRRPEVSSCIIGATKTTHVIENCQASGLKLSLDHLQAIDEIILPVSYSNDDNN